MTASDLSFSRILKYYPSCRVRTASKITAFICSLIFKSYLFIFSMRQSYNKKLYNTIMK